MNTLVDREKELLKPRSDSSMVDEYLQDIQVEEWCDYVQIPLWSMNTNTFSSCDGAEFEFRFLYGR